MSKTLVGLFFLLLVGCAEVKPEQFAQDKPLFEYATKLYNDKNYAEAIPFFESLKNRFPQSPYLIESELKVADAQYEKEDFAEAEVSYQNFRSLHPTNAKIPYVVFRTGMCQYKRIPGSIDRDQAHTKAALDTFLEVTNRWPDRPEAKEAAPLIAKCRRNLAEREMYVVDFYIRDKKWESALVRLKPLSQETNFPDLQMEAKYKMGLAYYKLKNKKDAEASLKDVVASSGKYKSDAESLMKKVQSL